MLILLSFFSFFSATGGQISQTLGPACQHSFADVNVVGGEDTIAEDVPWNVILEKSKKQNLEKIATHCGGNIITSTVILTAAHCVWQNQYSYRHLCPEQVRKQESAIECHQLENGCPDGCVRMRPEDLNVYIGITTINQRNRIPQKIKRIIIHDLWNKTTSSKQSIKTGHDMSLIILDHELEFNPKVRPVCLPDPNHHNLLQPHDNVEINGFGYTNVWTQTLADHLQTGQMQIKAKDECIVEYSQQRIENILQGDQLCAYANGTDSCNGDSGSGLIKYVGPVPVLVGVVSFGSRFCRTLPGVYTNVQSHVDWVLQKLQDIASSTEFVQTMRRCEENEKCEARETCPYIQQKYIEANEAKSKNQRNLRRTIISQLKSIVCNKQQKAFCCPIEFK